MILNRIDNSESGKKRAALIKAILPKDTLVNTMLNPKLDKMKPLLLKMLYAELEIYRAYPKRKLEDKAVAKEEVKTFDPRNHTTCFQGKAFRVKDNSYSDGDLHTYRKAVGTFNHAEWGDATLLEIWAADHYKKETKMVTDAFKYGAGVIKGRPTLHFNVNPLFMNEGSGKTKQTAAQKADQEEMDLLIARAMVHGVRTPEEAQRARRRKK